MGDSRPKGRSARLAEVSGRSELRPSRSDFAALKQIAAAYGDLVRHRFPNIPRRVSGYNLNYLLHENGFHVARALVGSGRHVRHHSRSNLPPGRKSA